jgi:hypothetical protein
VENMSDNHRNSVIWLENDYFKQNREVPCEKN